MDSLLLLLIISILWKVKINKDAYNQDYLAIDTTLPIKGVLAILVILHHLCQRTTDGFLFRGLKGIGYPLVGLFFFYSGYGLMKSYLTKKDYASHFLIKRLSGILIPYLLVNGIYYILYTLYGKAYSIGEICFNIFKKGEPIAPFSWFIIAIIYAYIVFDLAMKLSKGKPKHIIAICSIGYLFYLGYCFINGFGVWWYNTPFVMVVGMIFALNEQKYVATIMDRYKLVLPLTIIIWFILFIYDYFFIYVVFMPVLYLINQIIVASLFAFIIVMISMKVKLENPILNYLGKISLDLYLLQGILIGLLREAYYIPSDALWSYIVVFGTIMIAGVFHPLSTYLTKKVKTNF